jgi:hypothetical protein
MCKALFWQDIMMVILDALRQKSPLYPERALGRKSLRILWTVELSVTAREPGVAVAMDDLRSWLQYEIPKAKLPLASRLIHIQGT